MAEIPPKYDLIIAGAGMSGLSLLWQIRQAGLLDLSWVEEKKYALILLRSEHFLAKATEEERNQIDQLLSRVVAHWKTIENSELLLIRN